MKTTDTLEVVQGMTEIRNKSSRPITPIVCDKCSNNTPDLIDFVNLGGMGDVPRETSEGAEDQ